MRRPGGLDDFFQRPVRLFTAGILRYPYLWAEVEITKELLYDNARREVSVCFPCDYVLPQNLVDAYALHSIVARG